VLTVPQTSEYPAVFTEARGVILFQQLTKTDYDAAVFAAELIIWNYKRLFLKIRNQPGVEQ